MTRARAGFTLIELLVATGVFVVGFVAVFGLFLAGIRFRKLSDDTARAAVAASSIINEIRIDAGRETSAPKPCAPSEYIGDGFADNGPEPETGLTDCRLFAYTAQPGVYYRVLACTDLLRDASDAKATTLRLKLFVLPWISNEGAAFTLDEVVRRLRMSTTATTDETVDELVKRGLGFVYDAAIVRNPSWR